MGKWSKFKTGEKALKRYQPDETWQKSVTEFKNTPLNESPYLPNQDSKLKPIELDDAALVALLDHAEDTIAEAEQFIKRLNVIVEGVSQIFVDRFESKDITSQKFSDGSQLILKDEPYPFVDTKKDPAAREKLYAWLKKNKMSELLTLNAQTMKALVKKRMLDGLAMPPGVDAFIKTSISRRGRKGKSDAEASESNES